MDVVFGNGTIHEENWNDMNEFIGHEPSTILEIGCGLSTYLFDREGHNILSLETSPSWISKMTAEVSNRVRFGHYKYPDFPDVDEFFDYAFVDGPACTYDGRMDSMVFASSHSHFVFIHDSSRKSERVSIEAAFDTEIWHEIRYRDGLSVMMRVNCE